MACVEQETCLTRYYVQHVHRRRFFVDYANSKGAKSFCQVWLNFIILFQSEILPPNSGEDLKKGLRRTLVLSQSAISDFLLPSGYYKPKKPRGLDIFCPLQCQMRGSSNPRPPKIDAYKHVVSGSTQDEQIRRLQFTWLNILFARSVGAW